MDSFFNKKLEMFGNYREENKNLKNELEALKKQNNSQKFNKNHFNFDKMTDIIDKCNCDANLKENYQILLLEYKNRGINFSDKNLNLPMQNNEEMVMNIFLLAAENDRLRNEDQVIRNFRQLCGLPSY